MKIYVYIFSDGARASNYGIGTYLKQLINCLKDNMSVSLHIVLLGSDCDEFTIDKSGIVPVIHIPNIPNIDNPKVYGLYGRNTAYVLADYITTPVSGKLIFHFNYPTCNLLKTLKQLFPECYTVYTIHFDPMCLGYKGNLQLVKDKLIQLSEDENFYTNEKIMYEDADQIICLAAYMKELLVDCYKIPTQKISFIPNGIKDDGRTLSPKEKSELKQSLLIPGDEKLILFVGRLDETKGVDVLLNAFRKVVSEIPDSKLILIGDGNFKNYFSLCEGIWNKVIFTGMLDKDNLYKFYRIANIGVMPSFNEQCSYVTIEMMMHGLPLIGTTAPGLNEMIENPADKIQITYNGSEEYLSADHLAECIIRKLKNKEAKNYRSAYLENYTLSIMYQKTKTVYHLK